MRKVQGIIFFVLIIITINLKAKTSNTIGTPFIRNYPVEEYKANSQNWMAVQDKRGVMYFANGDCLLEFDGKSWTRINMPNHSIVRSLAIHDGTIYVGAVGEFGYLAFDHSGKLTYVSLSKSLKEEDKKFSNVWNTHATTHGIYFRTISEMFRYNNQKIEKIPVATIPESKTLNDAVLIGKVNDSLHILKEGHLQSLPHTQKFIRDTGRIIFLPYSNNKLLIATRNKGVFFIYDLEMLLDNGSFVSNFSDQNIPPTVIKKFPTEIDAFLIHHQLYTGTRINETRFAFGTTKGGIIIMDHEGKLIQVINRNRGLQYDTINKLFVDKIQNLWAATNQGISYIEISSPITQFNELNGLEEKIEALAFHRGKIYVTSRNYFLYLPEYKLNILDDNYKFMNVHNYYGDLWDTRIKDKILFTCGWDEADNERFRINYKEKIVIIRRNVYSLGHSKKFPVHVFLGLRGGFAAAEINTSDILKYDGSFYSPTGPLKPKYIGPENFADIKYIIRSIESDQNGDLWLTTRYNGILYLRFNSHDITDYQITHYNKSHGLPRLDWNRVFFINNQLLVGTQAGIYKAVFPEDFKTNPDSVQFVPETTFGKRFAEQSLPVSDIVFDDSGKIWIRSGDNVGILIKNRNESYSWNDIPFKKINLRSATSELCFDEMGAVWIAINRGIIRFDTKVKKEYKSNYHTLIRKVIVHRDKAIFNGTYYDPITKSNEYFTTSSLVQPNQLIKTLDYEDNSVTFEYSATFYEHAETNRFKYMLEGFDKDWSEWTEKTEKEYTNLPVGRYWFKVKAKNIFEYESSVASFEFAISPPWYQTIFAYIGYGFMFLFIFFGGIRLNSRRLIAAKHRLEKIVAERTAEVVQQKEMISKQRDQLEEANLKLEKLATTDGLTGIANFRYFEEFYNLEWKRCIRSGKPISVILTDVDFFKLFNDTYGHQMGDECLKRVAKVLDEAVNRPGDIVARYGGEEFVIVLSETDSQGAGFIAEKIRAGVESLEMVHEESGISEYVTISAGCATTIPKKDMDSSTLIRAADKALYQSKQNGRNRITVVQD